MESFYWNSNNNEDNEEKNNNMVGLILAIIGFFLCLVPIVGIIISIIALIFCKKDLKKNKNNDSARIGKVLSWGELFLGILATVVFLISIFFTKSLVDSSMDNAKKRQFQLQANEIEKWFEDNYMLSQSGFSADEFIVFCGDKGDFCVGNKVKFRVYGGREILEDIGINISDIDLVNSSVRINSSDSVCVTLYGSKNGIFSELAIDKIDEELEEYVYSTGCRDISTMN